MSKILGGYYIKARCIQESEIQHAPPHVREIWDWFIMKANHAPYKKHGNTFERGQLLCSYADIQEALHWTIGWRKKTYSKADCETAMKWLKKRVMVTTRKTTRGMIVTICNYDRFQNPDNYETYTETSKKPTTNLQTNDTINNKKKNIKKKEEINMEFPDWFPVNEWNNFVDMRRSIKKPLTDKAIKLAINKLKELKDEGNDPKEVLNQSTFSSWQGLFPIKENKKKVNEPQYKEF